MSSRPPATRKLTVAFSPDPEPVRRAALRDQTTLIDDADAVTQPFGLLHVMRGVEDRHSGPAELCDGLEDAVAALRIHPTVGSSRISSRGSCRSPTAMFARLFIPR